MRYLLAALLTLLLTPTLVGQSRTAEFLRRMDANRNGRLEPNEISDRARPYLERFTREAGISLSRSVSISQLESAARRYYERRSRGDSDRGGSSSSRGSSSSGSSRGSSAAVVRGFGIDEDMPLILGFGPDVDIRYPFIAADEQEARERLERYDRNNDGAIDREEAERGRWSDDPFAYDFNDDGLLSRVELAQRYARRRVAEENEERQRSQSSRDDDDDDRSRRDGRSRDDDDDDDRRRGDSRGYRSRDRGGPDRRTYELAYSIMSRHDRNRNGSLDRPEWSRAGDNISQADADRDGEISRGELAEWLSRDIQKRYGDFSDELPSWFFELDANQDQQISMAEFTDEWSAEKLQEFAGFDRNGDGFLTEKELLRSKSAVGGSYAHEKAHVIMPAGSLITDINVEDDFLIGDLDVQVSITHTNAEQLNAYLIGPDEQRIELFTGVGRHDDHFDGTIFDDESGERITRGRPPFRGRYLPGAAEKNEKSLSHFYGKSVRGVWQLEILTSRGDRPGMLHGWSIIVTRPDQLDSEVERDEGESTEDEEDAEDARRDRDQREESDRGGPPSWGGRRPAGGDGRPEFRRPGGGPPPSFRGRFQRGERDAP